ELTTGKGDVLSGDHQPWDGNRGVRSYTPEPFVPRDTDAGDVIVDPRGQAHRYDGRDFREIEAAGAPRPSPGAITAGRAAMPTPEGRDMADTPAPYRSPAASIELARELMREIREALTLDDNGRLPVKEEAWWDGMNMQPPDQAWRDMDIGQRYDLLLHAMDEAIWSLETAADADGARDSQKLALEFVQADDPQGYERFTQWDNRPIAAYDAEVAEMTRDGPGEESGLARAWRAASERGRLGLLADLAMDHGVEEEVFVRTARRVMGWPEPTAEQREAM